LTILFDLDGTLIDSTDAILQSFAYSYEQTSTEIPDDHQIESLIGYPLDIIYQKLGMQHSEIEHHVGLYKQKYRQISKDLTVLLPDAKEAIVAASKFARLGVVTTKTARYSKELLEHFEVLDYFELLVGREDVVNPKPHPEPVLKAVEFFQCDRDKCWLIGDTLLDIGSADAANINSVAVLSGYNNIDQLKTLTSFIQKDALSAVNFIKKTGITATI